MKGADNMDISLEQAVEIHARALTHRLAREAPEKARERARALGHVGDSEGHGVWMQVADAAERLLDDTADAPRQRYDRLFP
jgi:hypothetical protein